MFAEFLIQPNDDLAPGTKIQTNEVFVDRSVEKAVRFV